MTAQISHKTVIGLVAGILVLLGAFVLYSISPFPVPFDSHQWQNCTSHSFRYAMKDDLLRKYKLVGMSKSEVVSLLGLPDVGRKGSVLEWDMGSVPGHDDNTFIVKLKDGKVINVEVSSM